MMVDLEKKKRILENWRGFARKHGVELNPDIDIDLKAEVYAKYDACPCLVRWRFECPCKEALAEIKEAGACYCMLFREKGKPVDFKKHSVMTALVRKDLGIGNKKLR